jgi:hypothetical protein
LILMPAPRMVSPVPSSAIAPMLITSWAMLDTR